MNLVKLVEVIVSRLVDDEDSISVKEFENTDDSILIEVMVPSAEAYKVIGTNGTVINAIKTILQAASYTNGNKRVNINVDTY